MAALDGVTDDRVVQPEDFVLPRHKRGLGEALSRLPQDEHSGTGVSSAVVEDLQEIGVRLAGVVVPKSFREIVFFFGNMKVKKLIAPFKSYRLNRVKTVPIQGV